MSERLSITPDSDTQPLPSIIETETETIIVSFNKDFTPLVRSVIVGILSDKKYKDISEQVGVEVREIDNAVRTLKRSIVKRGHVYPFDKRAVVYTLQELGDISVKKIVK